MKYTSSFIQPNLIPRIFIIVLVVMSGLLRLSAQNCYQAFGENAGITNAVGLDSLDAAACRLKETIPEQFRSQFGVYGASHYLHIARTQPGTPPAVQFLLTQIEAQTPYYLLFVKESSSSGIFQKINVIIKLPDTEQFSCLTENDRSFISTQLQNCANDVYATHNNTPSFYPLVEAEVIKKLQRYIQKSVDCCASGNKMEEATCSFCPDIATAEDIRTFLENEVCAVKIPVKVVGGIAKNENRVTYLAVTALDDIEFKFREDDPSGTIATVMEDALSSDYFLEIPSDKKRGYVTSNNSICQTEDRNTFEEIKTTFSTHTASSSLDYGVWVHIWEDPADPLGQAFLYIASFSPGWDKLCAPEEGMTVNPKNSIPDVKYTLDAALSYEGYTTTGAYENKFVQSSSALIFSATRLCYSKIFKKDEIKPFTPNYNVVDEQILNCSGAPLGKKTYLSPAMQPVILPDAAIPDFSDLVSSNTFGFDAAALAFFSSQGLRWDGCYNPVYEQGIKTAYSKFAGYYVEIDRPNKYIALPEEERIASGKYAVLLYDAINSTPQGRKLYYQLYTAPATKPVTLYAEGVLEDDFTSVNYLSTTADLPPNPQPYSVAMPLLPTMKQLKEAWANLAVVKYGILLKVQNSDDPNAPPDFYTIKYIKNELDVYENVWFRFNCGTGSWVQISNPFLGTNEDWGAIGALLTKHLDPFLLDIINRTDFVHEFLDAGGMIPVIGVVFDVANGVIYFAEGDNTAAALCMVSAIPLIGDAYSATKKGLNKINTEVTTLLDNFPPGFPKVNATTAEIAEAANKMSGIMSGKKVNSILLYKTCPFNKPGEGPDDELKKKCQVFLNLVKLYEKADDYIPDEIDNDLWAEFIDEVQKMALHPTNPSLDLAEAVAKCQKIGSEGGPELFSAWSLMKKGGVDEAIRQNPEILTKLAVDLHGAGGGVLYNALKAQPELVKAWEVLLSKNVPDALRKNIKFLNRLSDNPGLSNFVDNLTVAGRTSLSSKIAEWVLYYDIRPLLKNGNIDQAITHLSEVRINATLHRGREYVRPLQEGYSYTTLEKMLDKIDEIISSTNDVNTIANVLDIPPHVVQFAKEHLFIRSHLVKVDGGFAFARFDVDDFNVKYWAECAAGNTAYNAELKALIAHEYIEGRLMEKGMIFRTDYSSSGVNGAHDLSSNESSYDFIHWSSFGRSLPSITLDIAHLENIDEVVNQIKIIEGL